MYLLGVRKPRVKFYLYLRLPLYCRWVNAIFWSLPLSVRWDKNFALLCHQTVVDRYGIVDVAVWSFHSCPEWTPECSQMPLWPGLQPPFILFLLQCILISCTHDSLLTVCTFPSVFMLSGFSLFIPQDLTCPAIHTLNAFSPLESPLFFLIWNSLLVISSTISPCQHNAEL